MSEFIANLVKDPKNPPEVVEITGFLGAAAEPGRTRIYLDTTLQNYVEVMEDKILHVEPVEGGQLGLSHIFIAADAQVFPREQPPRLDARTVFGGAVYQDYLNVSPSSSADIGVVPFRYLTIDTCRPGCVETVDWCPPPSVWPNICLTRQPRCYRTYHCPPSGTPFCPIRTGYACFYAQQVGVYDVPRPYAAMAQPMAPGAGMGAGGQQRAAFPPPPTVPVWRCPPVSYAYHCASQFWRCRYRPWGCPPLELAQFGGPPPSVGACPGGGFVPPEWGGGMTDPYAAFGGGYDPYSPYQTGY